MEIVNVMRVAGDWNKSIRNCSKKVQQWCEAGLGETRGFVSVVLADDAFIRDLNHQYRGKNRPTNVLSFPGEGDELGDIVLGYETIRREADEQKKKFADHTAHLVVHGVLHLCGFDHEQDIMAEKMENKEIAILAKLGIANPYESR